MYSPTGEKIRLSVGARRAGGRFALPLRRRSTSVTAARIRRPRHSIGAAKLQIAHYKFAHISGRPFPPCVYLARRHSSIGVIIPCGVFIGDPFATIISPVIVTYRMRVAPLSTGAEAFSRESPALPALKIILAAARIKGRLISNDTGPKMRKSK